MYPETYPTNMPRFLFFYSLSLLLFFSNFFVSKYMRSTQKLSSKAHKSKRVCRRKIVIILTELFQRRLIFILKSCRREKAISACMVQRLFEEYQFFPRYPDRELRITGVLFGSLVKHQLVSSVILGQALRCVLDALRKPPDFKMLSFGSIALDQFKERLAEWPQYCNHILQISHFRETQPELVKFIERALMRGGRNQHETAGNGIFLADQQFNGTIQSGPHSSLIPLEGLEQFPVPLTSIELEERKSFNSQLRSPGSEVLDPALHAALGGSLSTSASPPLAQGRQAKPLNTESATLLSQYSGMSLSMLDDRPKSANSLSSQSGISMQPGIGQSDPHPTRNFNTSAQDMADIADALGMGEKFWVMGYSGDGPHAWAALHYIPHQLAGVFMFGPMGNPYAKNMTKEEVKSIWRKVGRGRRTMYRVARHFPSLLPGFLKRSLIGKPVKIMRSVKKDAPPKDLALFEQDHFGQTWERSLREAMRSVDAKPHAEDYGLFCSDWGFKLTDLSPKPAKKSLLKRMFFFLDNSDLPAFSGPIHIFHGTEDSLVPLAFSQYAKRVLPLVQLHPLEGHGHFSWFCHCDTCHRELFKTLFGEVPGLDELDIAPEPAPTTPSEVPEVPPTTTAPEAAVVKEPDDAHPVVTKTQAAISSEADGSNLEERNVVFSDEEESSKKEL